MHKTPQRLRSQTVGPWRTWSIATAVGLAAVAVNCGTEAKLSAAGTGTGTTSSTTASGTTITKCAIQTPPTCTNKAAAPSYSGNVQTIIYNWCLECHDPNGIGAISGSSHPHGPPPGGFGDQNRSADANDSNAAIPPNDPNRPKFGDPNQYDPSANRDWSNYNNIVRHAQEMLDNVANCAMPRGAVMTSADKTALMQWLACGAPDN